MGTRNKMKTKQKQKTRLEKLEHYQKPGMNLGAREG